MLKVITFASTRNQYAPARGVRLNEGTYQVKNPLGRGSSLYSEGGQFIARLSDLPAEIYKKLSFNEKGTEATFYYNRPLFSH
jgi:hypothetical protein